MAKSKYEFKKLKAKPLPARIVDSTAVRVMANAAKKLSLRWKKFTAYAGGLITNIKSDVNVSDTERFTAKIAENQQIINNVVKDVQDKTATRADIKVMGKANDENRKLEEKLERILSKNVTVGTKEGESNDLDGALEEEKEASDKENDADTLSKAFDAAGIPDAKVEPVITVKQVEEPKVEPVVTPMPDIETPKVVVNGADDEELDPVIAGAIDAIKNTNKLKSENQKLMEDGKIKDDKLATLETSVASLNTQNKTLTDDNQLLKQTNSTQASTIANLSKENETLKVSAKNEITLSQKVGEYEGVISRHEKEREEMTRELEQLRLSSKENEVRAKKLEIDIRNISNEKEHYKNQILTLRNAMGYVTQVAPTVEEEGKVR